MDYEKETKLYYKDRELAKHYKNSYIEKSLRNLNVRLVARGEESSIAKAFGNIDKNEQTILDIPCGTGKLANILTKFGNVYAADISDEMMSLAAEDYEIQPNFRGFAREDACSLTFNASQFSIVVSLRLMHRVPQEIRKQMLSEFYRVSNKWLVVSFGHINSYHKLRLKVRKLFSSSIPTPCPATINEIERELRECGWEILNRWDVIPFLSNEIIFLCKK